MLAYLSSIYDYRDFLVSQKCFLDPAQLKRLSFPKFKTAFHKLWKLDVGLAHDLIFSLYFLFGRPAIDPAILIRSFVLMQHLGYLSVDKDGIPVCACGQKMISFGYDIQRCRKKYRCPLVMGKIDACDHVDECSSSAYGRVRYINDGDDIRAGGPLSYRSDSWKEIYKNRTSTERINDRTLNDYHLHQMYIRDGVKHAFFAIFAGINMHLDAWIKNIA